MKLEWERTDELVGDELCKLAGVMEIRRPFPAKAVAKIIGKPAVVEEKPRKRFSTKLVISTLIGATHE